MIKIRCHIQNEAFVRKSIGWHDMGGRTSLTSGTPPVDSDHDGIPDSWEKVNGLDTANATNQIAT